MKVTAFVDSADDPESSVCCPQSALSSQGQSCGSDGFGCPCQVPNWALGRDLHGYHAIVYAGWWISWCVAWIRSTAVWVNSSKTRSPSPTVSLQGAFLHRSGGFWCWLNFLNTL